MPGRAAVGSPVKSGWKHFIERPGRAWYYIASSVKQMDKYWVATVRVCERGAQLPDGRHIDARMQYGSSIASKNLAPLRVSELLRE